MDPLSSLLSFLTTIMKERSLFLKNNAFGLGSRIFGEVKNEINGLFIKSFFIPV
jgi:hypothetical protein